MSGRKAELTIFNLACSERLRPLANTLCAKSDAIVFVVDATADAAGLDAARADLHDVLAYPGAANKTVVVAANKSDLDEAMAPAEVAAALGIVQRNAEPNSDSQVSSASDGDGDGDGDGADRATGDPMPRLSVFAVSGITGVGLVELFEHAVE